MDIRYKLGIACGVATAFCFAFGVWRDSRHVFSVSCDERRSPHPQNECTDYYRDNYETSCAGDTMTDKPCPRAGARGGCRAKTFITWKYDSSDAGVQCSSDEKLVPTDWKEPED